MSKEELLNKYGINELNLRENWDNLKQLSRYEIDNEKEKWIDKIQSSESLFKNLPQLGAYQWLVNELILLDNNYIAVSMDDGHVENFAILHYDSNRDILDLIIESKL